MVAWPPPFSGLVRPPPTVPFWAASARPTAVAGPAPRPPPPLEGHSHGVVARQTFQTAPPPGATGPARLPVAGLRPPVRPFEAARVGPRPIERPGEAMGHAPGRVPPALLVGVVERPATIAGLGTAPATGVPSWVGAVWTAPVAPRVGVFLGAKIGVTETFGPEGRLLKREPAPRPVPVTATPGPPAGHVLRGRRVAPVVAVAI